MPHEAISAYKIVLQKVSVISQLTLGKYFYMKFFKHNNKMVLTIFWIFINLNFFIIVYKFVQQGYHVYTVCWKHSILAFIRIKFIVTILSAWFKKICIISHFFTLNKCFFGVIWWNTSNDKKTLFKCKLIKFSEGNDWFYSKLVSIFFNSCCLNISVNF